MTHLPRPRTELPTLAQRRAADNVRPYASDCDPSRCLLLRPHPVVFAFGLRCITCGFRWHGTEQTHCHLYEACDRCHDATDPCDTAQQIAEESAVQPVVWGPR